MNEQGVMRVDEAAEQARLAALRSEAGLATAKVSLRPGDALLLYTDGLTEARIDGGHLFGADRLIELAGGLVGASAQGIVDALAGVLTGFGTGLADDTAMFALSIPEVAS
ncbi:SpoIIE family protein phosphatase [Nonomuraea africana]|uniref:SpoIIE family protein phosphatase n=1 Tax=Nonomuraea africana TaxID=46171 RepID=UPI0033F697ED